MSGLIGDNTARASGVIAAAGGGGKILQIVTTPYNASSNQTTTSTSYQSMSSPYTVTIAPTKADSTVLLWFNIPCGVGGSTNGANFRIYNNTASSETTVGCISASQHHLLDIIYIDSPATTVSQEYELQMKNNTGGGHTCYVYANSIQTIYTTLTAIEIAA